MQTEHRGFDHVNGFRGLPNGQAEIVKIGDAKVGRLVFQPGWRRFNDVKPLANTHSCTAPHFQYHVAGRLTIKMDDNTEFVAGPGDVISLPSGHDAWVVRDQRSWWSTGLAPATTPSST